MAKKPEESNVSDDTIQQFMHEYAMQKRVCEEDNGVLRSILKRAKSAGCNTAQIVAVHQAKKKELDVVVRDVKDQIRYMNLRGIAITSEVLFGEYQPTEDEAAAAKASEEDAENRGYSAGMGGQTSGDNPFVAGTREHVAWGEGQKKGADAQARIMGSSGGKVASARKARPARSGHPAPVPVPKRTRGRASVN